MRAFTLIETLVYLALFALVMSGGMAGVESIRAVSGRTSADTLLAEEGLFVKSRIEYALRESSAINVPATASATRLEATAPGSESAKFFVSSTTLMESVGARSAEPLTSRFVEVSGFSAFRGGGTNAHDPGYLTVTFTLSARTPTGIVRSEDFSVTKYLQP